MAGFFKSVGKVLDATIETANAVSNVAVAANAASQGLVSMAAGFTVRQKAQDRKDCENVSKECLADYDKFMKELQLKIK